MFNNFFYYLFNSLFFKIFKKSLSLVAYSNTLLDKSALTRQNECIDKNTSELLRVHQRPNLVKFKKNFMHRFELQKFQKKNKKCATDVDKMQKDSTYLICSTIITIILLL